MPKDKRLSGLSIDDLLAEVNAGLKSLEKKTCRDCKQKKKLEDGRCAECRAAKAAKREEKLLNARHVDGEYVRVYHNDKLVYEHKLVMEQHLGRPLNGNEAITWRDGNRQNNDLSNLRLSLKNVPIEDIVCTNCSCRGAISIEPLPD
jgi:hypothetical protein